jgi:hypothetical protein
MIRYIGKDDENMSYYDSSYFTQEKASSAISYSTIWTIVSLVLAVCIGITLYFTIFSKKNEDKYNGFMLKLYNLVHFKFLIIEDIFKILYLISAIAITLLSLNYICNWKFLVVLLGGNLMLRIFYELFTLFIELCSNVRKIANKNKK